MRNILVFCLLFCCHNAVKAQEDALLGTWVLDMVVTQTGELASPDHPLFSSETIYIIEKDSITIYDFKLPASYERRGQILMAGRTLNFDFEDEYMYVWEVESPDILCFMKASSFVRKYPVFEPIETIYQDKPVFIANRLTNIKFRHHLNFHDFITSSSPMLKKHMAENFRFTIRFLLDKDSQISNIEIVGVTNEKLKKQIYKVVQKSQKYYQNNTGKDLLREEYFHFFKMQTSIDAEAMPSYEAFIAGNSLLEDSEFANAILAYEKGINVKIDKKRYGGLFYDDLVIRLGIAYLRTGQAEKACKTFRILGEETNFKVRNYLRFYCK